jgi:hypothetical protein
MIITENAHQKAGVLTSRIIARPAKRALRDAAAAAALEAARTALALDRSNSSQHT